MNQRTFLFSLAAVAFMAVMIAEPTFAAGDAKSSGAAGLDTLTGIITGNIGLLIGLGITVLGLWTWIIGQKTGAGIIMIIGGVLLTLAPGLFNGARQMMSGVVANFGGDIQTVDTDVPTE